MLPTPLNESPLTISGASPLGGEPLTLTTYAMRWLHQLWVPQKNSSGDGGGVKGQVQSMWNDSSGRTPKCCSSLFDLKEVVQRQQQQQQLGCWQPPQQCCSGRQSGAPSTCRGRHWWKMMDFLKNILVSVPGLGGYACSHRLPRVARSRQEPDDHSPCHLARSPGWVRRPPVTRGRRDLGQRGLGMKRGCGVESGTRAFPP